MNAPEVSPRSIDWIEIPHDRLKEYDNDTLTPQLCC